MTGFKVNPSDRQATKNKNAAETLEMVLNYVKKETIKPIRGAGRWIGFGLIAALSLSIGLVFGALGVLRLVQTTSLGESSNWSWLTYLIVLLVCLSAFWLSASRIRKGTLEKS